MPTGLISGREYSETDIFDKIIYPRMKEEPLIDKDDCIVLPVRNEKTPHFRKISNSSFGKKIGRAENNPTHDACVNYLHQELASLNVKSVYFSTYVFTGNGNYEEQVIFSPLPDSDYSWYAEKDARIAFQEKTYIQPDIAGRDKNKFSPRSTHPNVIIEVIRTHHPDIDTFKKLIELSNTNHHIYFYFIGDGKKYSKFNRISTNDGVLKFRVSHYLIGGKIYKNGSIYNQQKENETLDHWYQYLSNSYFTNAREGS